MSLSEDEIRVGLFFATKRDAENWMRAALYGQTNPRALIYLRKIDLGWIVQLIEPEEKTPPKKDSITCGHPYANHAGHGMCEACYARDYRRKHLEKRRLAEAKHYVKRKERRQRERDERLAGTGIRRAAQTAAEG